MCTCETELPRGWDFSRKPHLVLNRQTWPGSHQDHSTPSAASGILEQLPAPGPSLISTSLSPLQVSSVSPDPQGICKPKERSRRHPKDILNIHPKGATGTSPPAGQIPRVLQTKALPAWRGKWDLRMCCQFPRKGHGQEHLASSSHCFSSRSTQQQPPDTFTFGPTQSDPKYPGNNGLQERSRLSTSQGSETPGSLSGDNSQPGLP